jgi:signal transduction histidine kinase
VSRHLLRALEEERRRISRELHDESGQGLMVLRLYLGMLADEVKTRSSREKIAQATELLDRTIGDLRRIIARLSPRVLEEVGLTAAIRKEARELAKNTGIKPHLTLPRSLSHVDHDVQVAIYRSVQEALHNVARHSKARNVRVALENQVSQLHLLVQDDGIGIRNKKSPRSFGLSGMRERIAALGGQFRIHSPAGGGTALEITIPLGAYGSKRRRNSGELVPFAAQPASRRVS